MFDYPWYYYVLFILGLIVLIPVLFAAALADFVGDFVAENKDAFIEKLTPKNVISENGVTVSYGLRTIMFTDEQKRTDAIVEVEKKIRTILRDNRDADLSKHEIALGIKVYHTDRGEKPPPPPPPPPPPGPRGFYS